MDRSAGFLGSFSDMESDMPQETSEAEKAWYGAGIPSDTGGSQTGLPQELEAASAASSWEMVTPSDEGVHRNLERTVAAAYQTLEVGPVKHVWEDDFWGSLFAASPPDASKNFYGASLKRPLQPDLPETQVVPAAVKPRPAGRADMMLIRDFCREENCCYLEAGSRRSIG